MLKKVEYFIFSVFVLATLFALSSQMFFLQKTKYQTIRASEKSKTTFITNVIDGNTVETVEGDIVKLAMIEAPKKPGDCFYTNTKNELKKLVEGKTVMIDVIGIDNEAYRIAYLFTDNISVNLYMVGEGLAKVNHFPPEELLNADYPKLQKEAKEKNKGLWAACNN